MGASYINVKKVISISIVYFDLGHGTDYVYHGKTSFKGIHNNDKLELSNEQKNLFKKEEVYEVFPEYYILKVSKFDEKTKDGLDEWIYFLKTDEVMDNFKAKGLIEAKEKLDVLKMTKREKSIYESYLLDLSLKASLADTQRYDLEKAKIEGCQEGHQEGLEKGKNEEKTEIVINGNKEGLSNEILSKLTKLSIKEVEEILSGNLKKLS